MSVSELIETLKQFPGELTVYILNEMYSYSATAGSVRLAYIGNTVIGVEIAE